MTEGKQISNAVLAYWAASGIFFASTLIFLLIYARERTSNRISDIGNSHTVLIECISFVSSSIPTKNNWNNRKQTANENTTTSTSGFQTREQSVKGTKKKEQDQNPWNVKWAIE